MSEKSIIYTKNKAPAPYIHAIAEKGTIRLKEATEHLILLEGITDIGVLDQLISNIDKIDNLHLHSTDGKDVLKVDLAIFKEMIQRNPDSRLKSFLIIQDADADAKEAFKQITLCLKDATVGLATPESEGNLVFDETLKVNIGIFILKGSAGAGCLESMLLETEQLRADVFAKELECCRTFLSCVQTHQPKFEPIQKSDKVLLQSFLLTQPDFTNYYSGFEPPDKKKKKAPLWTANDPVFNPLKTFLDQLADLNPPEITE